MAVTKKDTGTWVATKGLNHPPGDKRVEEGEKVSDLLATSIAPLLDMEAIEPHDDVAKKLAEAHAALQQEG